MLCAVCTKVNADHGCFAFFLTDLYFILFFITRILPKIGSADKVSDTTMFNSATMPGTKIKSLRLQ